MQNREMKSKKLEGNPGKRKLNTKEPNPGKGMPDCPAWLLPEAKTEWIRLSEKLNQMGVLTEIDRSAFAAYCQSYARWKEAQEHINSEGATYETENGMQRARTKKMRWRHYLGVRLNGGEKTCGLSEAEEL